jgi:hypothetical protein
MPKIVQDKFLYTNTLKTEKNDPLYNKKANFLDKSTPSLKKLKELYT